MRDFHGAYIPVPTPKSFHVVVGSAAALDLQGFYGGPCRAPLSTPDGDGIDEITESLASAGLL